MAHDYVMDLIERSSAGGGDEDSPIKSGKHRHNKSQEEVDAGNYVSDLVDRLSVRILNDILLCVMYRNMMMIMEMKRKRKKRRKRKHETNYINILSFEIVCFVLFNSQFIK